MRKITLHAALGGRALTAAVAALLCMPLAVQAGPVPTCLHINETTPGQPMDLSPWVVKEHYTIVEFRSVY